jgi:hypothetical protein
MQCDAREESRGEERRESFQVHLFCPLRRREERRKRKMGEIGYRNLASLAWVVVDAVQV